MMPETGDELAAIGIKEILDHDSRPTFVIDLDPNEEDLIKDTSIDPVFCNLALRLHGKLYDAIVGKEATGLQEATGDTTFNAFKKWATGTTKFDDSKDVFPLSFSHGKFFWTGSTIQRRWRLISGNLLSVSTLPMGDLSSGPPSEVSTGGLRAEQEMADSTVKATQKRPTAANGSFTLVLSRQPALIPVVRKQSGGSETTRDSVRSKATLTLAAPAKAVPSWSVLEPKGILTEHQKFARSIDWAATPLGAMNSWSPEFREVTNLVMGNPHPAALFWGSDLTMLYNEPYAKEVAGRKHPDLMGTGFSGPFSELWDGVESIFAECARTGVSIRRDHNYLPMERYGILEETFISWSFTPLYGGTERILGFYNAPFDNTQEVVAQRRMETINRLGEYLSQAKTVKQYWTAVLDALRTNQYEVPFALLYSVGDSDDPDQSSISSGSTISLKSCYLEGTIGVPEGHIAAPKQLDLKRSREGFVPSFREAMRTREPTLLHTRDGTLPEALLDGIEWRGYGDPCRSAIIFPVRPTSAESVLAFLLLGLQPRRHWDEGYKSFTALLNRQLATSLASVMLYEEEIRFSRDAAEAAALEQDRLEQQLALQSSRLRRMTELSPIGMFLISPDGVLREANDRYFEMTGHPRVGVMLSEMSWMDQIESSSRGPMEEGWARLVAEHNAWTGEIQYKRGPSQPVNLNGEAIDYWVLVTALPELAQDGSLRSIMGSITDISHLKWAQGLQSLRLQEAEETRRQQNEFIDITSHEMRNPLSAILQCADDIQSTLEEAKSKDIPLSQVLLESCIEAAHTITLCVQHQKSIVDDILTISKLDSNLLLITPVPAQPVEVLKIAVKMFEAELQAKDIKLVFDVDQSFKDLKINWTTLDPSRVLQVLINFMTNAIKFTAGGTNRMITVWLAASDTLPTVQGSGFHYIPPRIPSTVINSGEDWGEGQLLYIRFKVLDTGCGLTEEEMQVLFERFKQASPRTHMQYGGSGLGLFISRQLAELHGGQIGVASEAGKGSKFGFFIQTRRTEAPSNGSTAASFNQGTVVGSQVPPQRQDLATSSPEASLLAVRAIPVFDPKLLDILVVEDNLVNQKVLVNQLRKVGCSVSVANDGIECLAVLEETHYVQQGGKALSVILLDLEMPNMDGITCIREIRNRQEQGRITRHVPVIAVTANVRDEQVTNAIKSGMDDVVSKPFRIPELMAKIEGLLKTYGPGLS